MRMKKHILIVLILSNILFGESGKVFNMYDNEDIAIIESEQIYATYQKNSFSRSKRILATKIYRLHQKTFYANCDYVIEGRRLVPLLNSCGFHYRKNEKRANRIEWEHIVPAWYFGHKMPCWSSGGRAECRAVDDKFREMEADMHNLVPAIGEINGDRSNFPYGNIPGEERLYGKVDIEIDFSKRLAEPKRNILGDIARVYLYMREKYNMYIDPEHLELFIKWNNQDPVTRWEKKKNLLVKDIQGDSNHFISNYSKITELKPIEVEEGDKNRGESVDSNRSSDGDSGKKDESFSDIYNQLEEKYSYIFDKISKPIATIILLIMTLFTIYMRRRKR